MKSTLLVFCAIVLFMLSCKGDKKEVIVNNWRAFNIENPELEAMMQEQELFIDTFGRNTDARTNERLYGVQNIDSMRKALKAQFDTTRMIQKSAMRTTTLRFREDGIAFLNFGKQPDTTRWYFDDKGALIMDKKMFSGSGGVLKMDVVMLSDTLLKLKYTENGVATIASFHPEMSK
jgi:hypothetical protein